MFIESITSSYPLLSLPTHQCAQNLQTQTNGRAAGELEHIIESETQLNKRLIHSSSELHDMLSDKGFIRYFIRGFYTGAALNQE